MNRKLLNFILSGAMLFSCVGFLSSCKDTCEDQYAVLMGEQTSLKAQLAAAEKNIQDLKNALNNLPADCKCDLTDVYAKLNANTSDIANLGERLTKTEANIAAVQAQLNELLKEDGRLAQLLDMADVQNLKRVLNDYKVATLPEALEKLIGDVESLKAQKIPELSDKVDNLEGLVNELQEALDLGVKPDDLNKAIEEINAALDKKIEGLTAQLTEVITGMLTSISELTTTVGDLKTDLANGLKGLEDKINAIDAEVSGLKTIIESRLNRVINSIVIQQVTNKVFGSLMLPLGIQTNILMAYHGYNKSGIEEFPSDYTSYEYNASEAFAYGELDGVQKIQVENLLLDESVNNAGNVYYTVNPSNVNLKGSVFSLVNSQDNFSGIELSQPVASDKLLMFGWSRADNGFYMSNARLSAANLDKCTLSLGNDLKKEIASTAKEFLHDLRHLDRPDISQIASTIKNVLQRFNNQLPANAIKGEYQYKDVNGNEVKAATYSNYGIAAATFQPQSFCFLEGQDNKFDLLPSIPTIDNFEFEMNEIKIDFSTDFQINGLDVQLNFNKIEINKDDFTVTGTVEVDTWDPVTGQMVTEERPITATAEGIEDLVDKINDELDKIVGQVNGDVIDQVNAMVADINKQVKDMIDKMSADVNEQLNDLLSDLSSEVNGQLDKYIGKINDLINKTNKLIARVNKVLANPNKYLQPLGIYTASNGQDLHVLSSSAVAPSRFNLNGGNATTLYFTSYTLETIAPAYKKFVKVVNAWKNGDKNRATVASAVNNVNAKGSLNKVVNGDQIRFAFAPEKGYTYEIVMQAVDYQGFTSTRRYFIEVR